MRGDRFSLEKWYFDCVTPSGAAFIGYRAALHWGWLRLGFSSSLVSGADGARCERQRLHMSAPPVITNGAVTWTSQALQLEGSWQALAGRNLSWTATSALIPRRLLESEPGTIDWCCVAPCAHVRVDISDEHTIQGLGYAERLRLTIPPWSLPFRTLYWGRFCSPQESLVWIRWDGEQSLTLVLHNGVEAADPAVSILGVCARGLELKWSDCRALQDRPIVSGALTRVKPLSERMPPAFAAAREAKWLSRATLRCGGRQECGWAIHEVAHLV